jgi:hypothetical protein
MKEYRSMKQASLLTGALAGLSLLIGLSGCSSYNSKAEPMLEAYRHGQFAVAAQEAAVRVEKTKGSHNELVWLLEAGTVARAAGQFEQSNGYFDQADAILSKFEAEPPVSVSAEAASMVSNEKIKPYRGRPYDGIMVNTYKALNYLQLGNPDAARVELNRAYERQVQAVEKNAKRIEKAQEEAKNDKQANVEKARKDPKFSGQLDEAFGDLNEMDGDAFSPYRDYVNPFTEFTQGLFFTLAGEDASDAERGVKAFARVADMAKVNPYLAADAKLADDIADGGKPPKLTYVIFETGLGPKREEIRIDLPVFIVGGGVDYVGAAFPRIVTRDDYVPALTIMAGGKPFTTQVVSNLDNVVKREFKNELPATITKIIMASASKAAAAYAANEATKSNAWANIATRVTATVYQAGMNQADLRTWLTLPKQLQYARLETPADGQLTLTESGGAAQSVALEPGQINIVFIKSVGPGTPLQVQQFKLR